MKPAVVTFAQLPDEEAVFLAFLAKTGDVWARAANDHSRQPEHTPAPVAEFMQDHAASLAHNATVHVYLGSRADVLKPVCSKIEGRSVVDIIPSCLVGYTRGEYYPGGELAQSNLFFYRGSFQGEEFTPKPEPFLRWAAKVLGWARRNSPRKVRVHRCHYETRATAQVAAAAAGGMKVWH